MKRSLPLIFDMLHALALALWIGGAASALIMVGAGGTPAAFQMRSDALIEFSAIVIIGIQFLTKRRYINNRTLYVGDGIRHLLTFTALLIMEYVKLTLHSSSAHALRPNGAALVAGALEAPLAALQIVVLAAVSGFTIWLASPHALAFAAILNAKNGSVSPSGKESRAQAAKGAQKSGPGSGKTK